MTVHKSVWPVALVGAVITALVLCAPLAAPRAAAQVKDAPSLPAGSERRLAEGMVDPGGERQRLLKYTPDPVKLPVPRTKWDGKPDFSGVYWTSAHPLAAGINVAMPPTTFGTPAVKRGRDMLASLLRPEARAAKAKLDLEESFGLYCWPGSPALGGTEITLHVQMVSAPGFVAVIDQYNSGYRVIPTDGRPHDPAKKPSFLGDSVGRWEGDTLVVDVTNFIERNRIGNDFGDTWSDALHVVERWSMADGNTLQWEGTFEDPKLLTGPWTAPMWRRGRLPGVDISQESHCLGDQDETVREMNDQQREASKAGRQRQGLR